MHQVQFRFFALLTLAFALRLKSCLIFHDELTRRRSSRIVYAGFIYPFGQSAKKPKGMEFDSSL